VTVRRVLIRVAAIATLLGGVGLTTAGAAPPPDLAPALHGAVETQAFTAGMGALALFVDPGTAYAYSTMDRDDYGGGSVSYTMTARGANLNPGTIPAAVIWAAPECHPDAPEESNGPCYLSGGHGTPNTGLHEAGGFPGYAEALYPPPPTEGQGAGPSRERVYKCIVNKDAMGAAPTGGSAQDLCKSSKDIPLTTWAEAVGDSYSSFGFSRAGGFEIPGAIKIAGSESRSEVKAVEGGKLDSSGYSVLRDISIADGQIKIESTRAAGHVLSGTDGAADRSASCSFEGLTIGGKGVTMDELESGDAQPLLDAVTEATGFRVDIFPPSPVVTEVREGGKHVAECTGIRVFITDLHTGSPVPVCTPPLPYPEGYPDEARIPECVPALGNRFEFTFGKISVQQSVNKFAGPPSAGASGLIDPGLLPDVGGSAGASVLGESISAPDLPAGDLGAPAAVAGGSPSGSLESATVPFNRTVSSSERNLALIGGLTAAGAAAIIFVVLLMIGVVSALATGGPLRIPGF
jgi:hypothetical protein